MHNLRKQVLPPKTVEIPGKTPVEPLVSYTISDLICGIEIPATDAVDKDLVGMVGRLRSDVMELDGYIHASLDKNSPIPTAAVFPFLARKFLELSTTSILARLDPLRVIAARKHQADNSYDPGSPNSSSIRWTGDIFPERTKNPNQSPLWSTDRLKSGVDRSLFGVHFQSIALEPSLTCLLDAPEPKSDWLRTLSTHEKPFEWIRSRLSSLYSQLSKGVHAEYLIDEKSSFDHHTVLQCLSDSYMVIAVLATASHLNPLFARSIPRAAAFGCMRSIEQRVSERALDE